MTVFHRFYQFFPLFLLLLFLGGCTGGGMGAWNAKKSGVDNAVYGGADFSNTMNTAQPNPSGPAVKVAILLFAVVRRECGDWPIHASSGAACRFRYGI